MGRVYDATRFTFVTFLKNGAWNGSTHSYLILFNALDAVSVKTTMSDFIKHSANQIKISIPVATMRFVKKIFFLAFFLL